MAQSSMKIAILSPISADMLNPIKAAGIKTPPSHRWGMNADLVNGLLAKGHHVDVITASPMGGEYFFWSCDNFSLTMIPVRGRLTGYSLFIRPIHRMRKALLRLGPHDIVHAHWLYEYTLAAKAAMGPILITIHDWPWQIFKFQKSLYRLCKYLMSIRAQTASSFATAPSRYMAEISQSLGFKNVTIIPNATPAQFLDLNRSKLMMSNAPELLAINIGFDSRKNVATLIEAFGGVLKHFSDAQLRLIGPGYEQGGPAFQFAKTHNLLTNIDFLGQKSREEIKCELSRTTLFVHPSLEESFGIVLIEAMAQGVPVVGGRNSGAVPWVLGDGGAGILTNVESASDMSNDIVNALSNHNELARIASAGQDRVRREFTTELMVERYEQEYIRIVALVDKAL
jgi:L-malate glycosyltransferase